MCGSRILVRGAQQSFDPKRGQSPKFARNGFSLKIACKLHDFEEILGAKSWGRAPRPPWIRCCHATWEHTKQKSLNSVTVQTQPLGLHGAWKLSTLCVSVLSRLRVPGIKLRGSIAFRDGGNYGILPLSLNHRSVCVCVCSLGVLDTKS